MTQVIGSKIVSLSSIQSTNDVAWKEVEEGAPDGTCIFADEQTEGRGRQGRSWYSPAGTSIYLSVILRKKIPMEQSPLITALGAIAVVETIEKITGFRPSIRFPNDVFLQGKKISGVLVESRVVSSQPKCFVLGLGFNVNQDQFPKELTSVATSLCRETGKSFELDSVKKEVMSSLDRWYAKEKVEDFLDFWKAYCGILRKPVQIIQGGESFTGVIEDIDLFEGLLVRLADGLVRQFRSEHVEQVILL